MESKSGELTGFRNLYEFSRLLLSGDDPEDLLDRLVAAARSITGADEVILFQIEEGDPRVTALSRSMADSDSTRKPNYSETLVQEVMKRAEPLLLPDLMDDSRFAKVQSIQQLSITSAMGAPLFFDGELRGVIYASRSRFTGNFSEENLELMTVAASQASLLIGRLLSVQALQESEAQHRSLVEMSPSAIAVIKDREVIYANQAALDLWGIGEDRDLLGREVCELFDKWRSSQLLDALRQGQAFESLDAWVLRKGQEVKGLPVEARGQPIRFAGSSAMQLMINSVGEREAILARRVRSDRLMAMGTVAATVGHEINNPLSYVYANLDFVVEELERWWAESPVELPDEAARYEILEGLRAARTGTERIRAVVDSIQNFSRLDEDESQVSEVAYPLDSSLRVARNQLGADVDLQVDIRATAPVPVGAAGLGQVFLNILVNAAQALSEMPTKEDFEPRLHVRTRQIDDEVIVEIEDNGPGIDPEVRRHIFDPFVTTRSDKDGTGLGLAICSDIIESAGGTIEVESIPGMGTLFRIRLPAVAELATHSIEVVTESETENRGKILVIDPEPALGRSLKRVLQGQHDVSVVSTIGEAVDMLSMAPDFDVILCDLRLRGGMGRDLFRWTEENAPNYWDRLVAMIANRVTQSERAYLDRLPNPWLVKPFDLSRLRSIINSILDVEEDEDSQVS